MAICPCYPDRAPAKGGPECSVPGAMPRTATGCGFAKTAAASSRLTCAQCGGDLAPGKRFCGSCGAPAAGQSAAHTASPESYTPKHLAAKILTSKSALEGERKQVTVLFADLKGSMELLADRDPEEARKLLDPVLERMMEAVHHYEGTVNQVMGDGIMALFGAPIGHEDHAVRACYAALRMQRRAPSTRTRFSVGGLAGPDSRRSELGRGGGAGHRQRPAHGLHRRRPDDASGRPHGADGQARIHVDHRPKP